jgi:hypothetical protein
VRRRRDVSTSMATNHRKVARTMVSLPRLSGLIPSYHRRIHPLTTQNQECFRGTVTESQTPVA